MSAVESNALRPVDKLEAGFIRHYEAFGEVDIQSLLEPARTIPESIDFAVIDAIAIKAAAALGVSPFRREGTWYRIPPGQDLYEPEPVGPEDRVYRVGEFRNLCEKRVLKPSTGNFLPAVNGIKDVGFYFPVDAWQGIPEWATHVVWMEWQL